MFNLDHSMPVPYNQYVKRLVLVAVLLAAVVLAKSCALAEGTNIDSSGVQLVYKFAPGSLTRYQITQEFTGTRTFPGATQESRIAAKLTTVIRIRCMKALPDGSMELAIDTESGSLEMAGKPSNYKPPQTIRKLTISPTGRVITPAGGDVRHEDGQRRSPLDFASPDSVVVLAPMPQQPMQVAGNWEAELPLPMEPTATLRLGFALNKVTAQSDGRVASIKQTLNTTKGASPEDEVRTVQGAQHGEAELLFSVDRGMLISASGTISSIMVTGMDAPSVPATETTDGLYKMEVQSKFTVSVMGAVGETGGSGAR